MTDPTDSADPLPGVPDSGDDGANGASVPPASETRDPQSVDSDAKPIRYRRADAGEEAGNDATTDSGSNARKSCGCESCGCGGAANGGQVAADGSGGAVNVGPDGSLGDVQFTTPTEGTSQDVENGDPAERVGVPVSSANGSTSEEGSDGVPDDTDLDTPSYSIRSRMNDIETPDEKTWFMELDTAVIDDGLAL